jgi:hypothetical protein
MGAFACVGSQAAAPGSTCTKRNFVATGKAQSTVAVMRCAAEKIEQFNVLHTFFKFQHFKPSQQSIVKALLV